MRAPLLAALAAALAVSCTQSPPGRCGTHADCPDGRECSGGVCVRLVTDGQVGSRCVRESDCASWARCAGDACALAPGRCGGNGDCAGWQICGMTHTCTTGPGACAGEADCAAWQDCGADHRCALTPGLCGSQLDCQPWQFCDAAHLCQASVGRCGTPADCQAWQECSSNTCVTAPGRCSSPSDCAAWEVCDASHACVLATGRCVDATGCADWQVCTAAHRCDAAPGRCADSTSCASWQICDGTHACVLASGRCAVDAECQEWQACDGTHTCALAAGRCTTNASCQAWQSCDVGAHRCATAAGFCATSADCADWQTCGTDHVCATAAGRCATAADCPAYNTCDLHTCSRPAGGCGALPPECTGRTSGARVVGGAGNYILEGIVSVPDRFAAGVTAKLQNLEAGSALGDGLLASIQLPRDGVHPDAISLSFGRAWHALEVGGFYVVDGVAQNSIGVDTHMSWPFSVARSCSYGRGWFEVCGATTSGPWGGLGTPEPSLWDLTLAFSQTSCDAGPAPFTGCIHYVQGSQPGAYGPAEAIAAAGERVCGLAGGVLRCWGGGDETALSPDPISTLTTIAAIAMQSVHGCGTTTDGQAVCWGVNDYGQVGAGASVSSVWAPIVVVTTSVARVFPAREATFALMTDGSIQFWGSSMRSGRSYEPAPYLPPGTYVEMAGGDDHECGLTAGGAVHCWGFNDHGELGDGTTADPVPLSSAVAVIGLQSGVEHILSVGHTTCALVTGGGVRCWGRNDFGQLGDGTVTDRAVPVTPIALDAGVTQLDLSENHACAVVSGGVQCWGGNGFGTLGDGTKIDRGTPGWVTGLGPGSDVAEVAVSLPSSCARRVDGSVRCWGARSLGTGTSAESLVPAPVRW